MRSIRSAPGSRLRIAIRLTPRASRNEIVGWEKSGQLRVRVTSPPVDEAANQELVRFLAKVLGVRKTDIIIATGAHSRVKQLDVPEMCKNRLLSFENIC